MSTLIAFCRVRLATSRFNAGTAQGLVEINDADGYTAA
jgi:hypothetical protein